MHRSGVLNVKKFLTETEYHYSMLAVLLYTFPKQLLNFIWWWGDAFAQRFDP
jgi:hypothetical protein